MTSKPVLGTIPIVKLNIPDEDSLHSNPKQVSWTSKYMKTLDEEIENLSKIVKKNLDMKKIGDLIN